MTKGEATTRDWLKKALPERSMIKRDKLPGQRQKSPYDDSSNAAVPGQFAEAHSGA